MNLLKTSRLLILPVMAAALAQATYGQAASAFALVPGPAAPGTMRSHAWMLSAPLAVHGTGAGSCTGGCYYFPADISQIYEVAFIANGNGGSGMTVGIVDAYYNPQTLAD